MADDLRSSMAKARTLWNDAKYEESAQAMMSVGTFDAPPQAQHNKLLAEFTAQDRKDPKRLLAALEAMDQKVKPRSSQPATLSDGDASPVLKLNTALLLVQQNRTASAAVKILEPLFENIEPMQEHAAVRVCILLTELYLADKSFARAAKVLHYLETAYGVMSDSPEDRESLAGQNSDLDIGGDQSQSGPDLTDPPRPPSRGPSDPPRPPSRGAADPPRPLSRGGGESSRLTDNPPPGFGQPPEPFTSPSKPDSTGSGVTEEGEIAAVLSRMLDQAGRMDAQAVAQGNRFMEVGGVAVVQLVRVLRARLNLALNQLKPARRDIKAILAADPNSPQGISLKARLELQRQNYRKAARILTISPATPAPEGSPSPSKPTPGSRALADRASSGPRADPGQPSQQNGAKRIGMLSNMGCVQHTLGKSNTAALCFAQALRTSAQTPVLEQGGSGPQGGIPHNANLHITYSAGLQALQLTKYSTALRCFQASAAALYDRPLLWLRMADCCLGVLPGGPPARGGVQDAPSSAPQLTPEAHAVAISTGVEPWRQVVQGHESSDGSSEAHMAAMCHRSISHAQAACHFQPRVDSISSSEQHEGSGDVDGTSQIHSFATQCLHNTVFLCDQALPQPTDHSSSSNHAPETGLPRPPDTTAESPEALPNPSGGLSHPSSTAANPSGGPGYPSNGHRGRLGSTQEGSAAEAAEQLAMLSLDRSRASSGAMDAAVMVAEAAHRQQLHTIKAAALVNLAYLQLQQQQWQQAVVYSQQLLQVPGVPADQQLLAHCYAAEALCNLQSPDEAAMQLQTAVALQGASGSESLQQARKPSGNAGPMMTDAQESKPLGGASHALQVAVLVNAASMQANQGQLQQAQDYATKAIGLQPHSQQALLALVYVELCKGNCNAALTLLKQQHVPL